MDDALDTDLFNISLSDDETGVESTTAASGGDVTTAKEDRNAQSEEAYLALKKAYRPKLDNGDLWKSIILPLAPDAHKTVGQEILHAVEELYFFRRYAEAVSFVRMVVDEGNGQQVLDGETRRLLNVYEARCCEKMCK